MCRNVKASDFPYASHYCEENVWHLCNRPEVAGPRSHAVFIGSTAEFVPMWRNRHGDPVDGNVWWDYHTVLLTAQDDLWFVYDFDTTLPFRTPLERYLSESFPFAEVIDPEYRPLFRLVPADVYVTTFSSDRRHMRDSDGNWLAPPPAWPAICHDGIHNLDDFIDPTSNGPGIVVDLEGLRAMA